MKNSTSKGCRILLQAHPVYTDNNTNNRKKRSKSAMIMTPKLKVKMIWLTKEIKVRPSKKVCPLDALGSSN